MARIFAVIMAGRRGERLWPLSTPERPKQFLKLWGQRTMLQETVARISPLIPEENIYVEPAGRSAAPCKAVEAAAFEDYFIQG